MSSSGDAKGNLTVGPVVGGASLFDEPDESATVVDDGLFGEQQDAVPNYPAIARYGRFDILGRIAMGGMAEIFLAREMGVNGAIRHLVIKRVLPHIADDDEFIRMFIDEATISTRLYHPNVCHMYEAGQTDGSYFMAMEWVHGTPLRRVIRRAREKGGVPVPIACEIIRKIGEALHYAHAACDAEGKPLGIVHRDVSPHNMMVRWDGVVKLLDFGIAKAAMQESQTDAGVVKGKYSYLSPEQCHGRDVDPRADVFALGICLFEVLTGKPLYHRGSVLNTMTAIAKEAVPSARDVIPEISPELDRIVQRALAKDPNQRYQTALQLSDALGEYLELADEMVHPPLIAEFLNTLFTEADRSPLPENVLRQTGSFPQLTPSGSYGSGSFGPFGQGPRRGDGQRPLRVGDIESFELDVVIEEAVMVDLSDLTDLSDDELRMTRKSPWIMWAAIGAAALLLGGIIALAIAISIN